MTDCNGCAKWVNRGPNCVPWGDTFVNEGDTYECSDGYDGDCPEGAFVPEEPRHSARCGHGLDEEDWDCTGAM